MAPAPAVPPALPPSVEEAYRRKCIQLKQRTSEVEEANDAARLRLARLKRQVEKMRLERAFLLEQLAKRTSTNVEDSDGSPSPPPTPKEKPLRIKRGHRKPSAFANVEAPSSTNAATPGSTFISQNLLVRSPSGSEAPSAAQQGGDASTSKTNGVHKGPPRKPPTAFELYCNETRPALVKELAAKGKSQDDDGEGSSPAAADVDKELERRWRWVISDELRAEYDERAEELRADYKKDRDAFMAALEANADDAKTGDAEHGDQKADSTEPERSRAEGDAEERGSSAAREKQQQKEEEEDVEMGNYDTDQETQGEKPEE